MNIFLKDHQDLLRELLNQRVQFMMIGGYSVIYYGYRRTTGDLDLWVKPDNENKKLLIKALASYGFSVGDLSVIDEYDFTDYVVISIGNEPLKVDFITRINLVDYDVADKQKVIAEIDGLLIPIIHKNDLILSKMDTGKDKDKADIQELQRNTGS